MYVPEEVGCFVPVSSQVIYTAIWLLNLSVLSSLSMCNADQGSVKSQLLYALFLRDLPNYFEWLFCNVLLVLMNTFSL